MFALHLPIAASEDVDVLANVANFEQARLHTVVKVCRKVSDLVGEIDQLRFERRPLIKKIFCEFRMLVDLVITRVLDDALANAECEIESTMRGVALLEVLD